MTASSNHKPTFQDVTLMYSLVCQLLDADADNAVLKFDEFCTLSELSIRLRHTFKDMLAARILDAAGGIKLQQPSTN